MAKDKSNKDSGEETFMGLRGIFGGLGTLLEKLSELAEKGEALHQSGELHGLDPKGKLRGVYGFTIRTGLGGEPGIKVEPFGNVRNDEQTGQPVVHEVHEPMVDVFEEADHVLVVAELPGISEDNLQLELKGDILTITAARRDKKYHKEVLLPAVFTAEKMSHSCRNGILEVRFAR
jgi:HSP20 family protein